MINPPLSRMIIGLRSLVAVGSVLFLPSGAQAGPVAVRHLEGPAYGILVLTSTAGRLLAHGESIQTVRGHHVDSRLVFRFKDGSLFDERVLFSQEKVFSLSYRLVQRGPAFPSSADVAFQRGPGQYRARIRDKPDGDDEIVEGRQELPADMYNAS